MLLMGMLNWMFTWWKPNGELKHRTMAPIVFELFTRGLQSFDIPEPVAGDGAGPRGRKAAPARARSQG
jgi:TetR/AcrR family transcriptional regulator